MPVSFDLQELASAQARTSRPTKLRIDAHTLILVAVWRRSRGNQHGHGDVRSEGQPAPDTSQDAKRISDGVPSC
jgi:hypothetical protein